MKFQDYQWHMQSALELANEAYRLDEVPIGAVVVDKSGKVIGKGHNLKEQNKDATAHAEILALQQAAKSINDWRLEGCTLFVTLEPCPMCLSAISQFRIDRCVFGAYDKKGGALSLDYMLFKDYRLNHRFSIMGGVLHKECATILSSFF